MPVSRKFFGREGMWIAEYGTDVMGGCEDGVCAVGSLVMPSLAGIRNEV